MEISHDIEAAKYDILKELYTLTHCNKYFLGVDIVLVRQTLNKWKKFSTLLLSVWVKSRKPLLLSHNSMLLYSLAY